MIYLSDEEKAFKQKIEESIKDFYKMYEEFISNKTKLNLTTHDHFSNI